RDWMAGGRAGMTEQDDLRIDRGGALHDLPERHRTELGVEQLDMVTSIDQRPADGEETERGQLLTRNAAADRGMRRIDEKKAHGWSPARGGFVHQRRVDHVAKRPREFAPERPAGDQREAPTRGRRIDARGIPVHDRGAGDAEAKLAAVAADHAD